MIKVFITTNFEIDTNFYMRWIVWSKMNKKCGYMKYMMNVEKRTTTWYNLRGVIQRTPTPTPRENVGWKLKRAIYGKIEWEEMKGVLIVFVGKKECFPIESFAEIVNEICEDWVREGEQWGVAEYVFEIGMTGDVDGLITNGNEFVIDLFLEKAKENISFFFEIEVNQNCERIGSIGVCVVIGVSSEICHNGDDFTDWFATNEGHGFF